MKLQLIQDRIFNVRGFKVMLDFHLAELYGTDTKRLKESVRRNKKRFPSDFMFELTTDEYGILRTQIASLEKGQGRHTKYLPFAFTEQGVAMLSSVVNSDKAIQVNIAIIRAFVLLRQHLADYKNLKHQIAALEKDMNRKFKDIHEALQYLFHPKSRRTEIGFKQQGRIVKNEIKKGSVSAKRKSVL